MERVLLIMHSDRLSLIILPLLIVVLKKVNLRKTNKFFVICLPGQLKISKRSVAIFCLVKEGDIFYIMFIMMQK